MGLEASNVRHIGARIAELHDAVYWSKERNWNGARWYQTRSVGRPQNAAESSEHETCRHSLALDESTTRDGLRLASRTLEVTLRPMYLASHRHLGFAGVFDCQAARLIAKNPHFPQPP